MEVHLALYDNDSLKAKRSIVKRLIQRSRNQFNVSISEVEDNDMLDRAVLGVVSVGNDARYVDGMLAKLENFIERQALADILEAPRTIEHY
jgi:uncharacterized protein YlxP (DUF503 family)